MGTAHPFPRTTLQKELQQLDLNVRCPLVLSHAAARSMASRGGGRILNVGSTAALWSHGTYAASKAWMETMTRGLSDAGSSGGVSVTLLVPGFTRTEFHARSGVDPAGVPAWMWLDARRVAVVGLDALEAGRSVCVPSLRYAVMTGVMARLSPTSRRRVLSRIVSLGTASQVSARGASTPDAVPSSRYEEQT